MRIVPKSDFQPLSTREERIDFIRGAALLMIFVDHVEFMNGPQLLCKWTLRAFGLSDAAEVFVFTSGYVAGIAYGIAMINHGFMRCFLKAIRRAGQLWAANLITLWIVFNIAILLPADSSAARFDQLLDGPWPLLPYMLLQIYQPSSFEILPMYMAMILFLPLFLWGIDRNWRTTWCVVVAFYSLVQWCPCINYPVYNSFAGGLSCRARSFNPLGWQLLFLIGATLGWQKLKGRRAVSKVAGWFALAIIIVIAFAKHDVFQTVRGPAGEHLAFIVRSLGNSDYARKTTLGPVRLLHFGLLAVSASLLQEKFSPHFSAMVRPVTCCGRHPLVIFCAGTVLCYAAHPILALASYRQTALIIYELCGSAGLIAVGVLLTCVEKSGPPANVCPHDDQPVE